MDVFDMIAVQVDSECISQDLDDIDLYAEKLDTSESESDIKFE